VVTGHDDSGRSVFVKDEPVEAVDIPGVGRFLRVWSADRPMTYPDDGGDPQARRFFPPLGGFRCVLIDMPAGRRPPRPDRLDIEALLPGLVDVMEPDQPGMHRTDTTDFAVVLSGSVVLELDDGAEVTLSGGDLVVQNGTRHRWRTVGDAPARLFFVLVGAHRESSPAG
jgi:mannose-6-phosphate isomerase-like protein (cupin superfamily)